MTISVEDRPARIRKRLEQALDPSELEIRDDSHLHQGHAGARGGGGHFAVRLRSVQFVGLNPLQRHRLVYAALTDMMPGEIHALSIQALTPSEP